MSASNPFLGEIRMWGGRTPPTGWAFCNGYGVSVSDYPDLFKLIGTTYGGDGEKTFNLPDMRGRVPVHHGGGLVLGQAGGVETVTLTKDEIPAHSHEMYGSVDPATRSTVADSVPASIPAAGVVSAYSADGPARPLDPSAVVPTGGGAAHDNVQPFVCVTFMISLTGADPSGAEGSS